MKNKLWSDCSKEEHKEIKKIENRRHYIKKRFKECKLSLPEYLSESIKLENMLNEVEKKYE